MRCCARPWRMPVIRSLTFGKRKLEKGEIAFTHDFPLFLDKIFPLRYHFLRRNVQGGMLP